MVVNICESFFTELGIRISVDLIVKKSKTKCMVFPPELAVALLILYNQPLPFVSEAEHLGHSISIDERTSHDIDLKRREFVGKYHSLRQELGDQSPVVYLKLINIFLSHFYGHLECNVQGYIQPPVRHTQIHSRAGELCQTH